MPILSRLSIVDVWKCLGGGPLQGRWPHFRACAIWRDKSDGFSISIRADANVYFDFVAGEGGGVLRLVEVALNCDQAEALRWLITNLGLDDTSNTVSPAERAKAERDRRELEWAAWWRMAAEILAEWALETLDSAHPERLALTSLLETIRRSDAALIGEFREWRRVQPELARAMAHAGRLHDARMQRRLAVWLRRLSDEQAA